VILGAPGGGGGRVTQKAEHLAMADLERDVAKGHPAPKRLLKCSTTNAG
jgi:hypothetical protein